MASPTVDLLVADNMVMHDHSASDLGAVLDSRYLNTTSNLSDLENVATARTNLGLVAGGTGDIWVEKAGDTMVGNLILNDNVSVLLGTGSDGELFHDGSNTYFQNNTGNIIIENDYLDGDITFKVNDGGVDTTVMTLDGATGNVGIGTTAPGALLDVRGSAIFNEAGADVDFRVEGDTDTTLIFADASADKVGIGVAAPATKLDILGDVTATNTPTLDVALRAASSTNYQYPYISFTKAFGTPSAPTTIDAYNTIIGSFNFYAVVGSSWAYREVIAGFKANVVEPRNKSGLYSNGRLDFVVYDNTGTEKTGFYVTGYDNLNHFVLPGSYENYLGLAQLTTKPEQPFEIISESFSVIKSPFRF